MQKHDWMRMRLKEQEHFAAPERRNKNVQFRDRSNYGRGFCAIVRS